MLETFLIVCCVSLLTFFCISALFKHFGIVDKPDGIRKIHKGEIPLSGGFSLYASFLIIFLFVYPSNSEDMSFDQSAIWKVFLISPIILFLGLWDDIRPLPTSIRLIFQIFASWLVIIVTDVYLLDLGDLFGFGNIYLGAAGIPLTIFMVVGVCNAFNMIDGMDGLVGIVLLVLCSAMSTIINLSSLNSVLFLTPIVAFIFLLFNLGLFGKKQKIFLGDSGSTCIGFIAAWTLIILSQGEERIFQPVTALWLIMLPLIDALSTFLSRLWNKKSMFVGDRTHIHHMLLDSGLKKEIVLFIFLLISIISSSFGVFANFYSIDESTQFYGFLTIWLFYYLLIKYPLTNSDKKVS